MDAIKLTASEAVEAHIAELTALLLGNLRDALFSSRAFLRPADLRPVVDGQVDAFLAYLRTGDDDAAQRHGAHLCGSGVGDLALVRVGHILHRFGTLHMAEAVRPGYHEQVEEYQCHVIRGYIAQRSADILGEQERIRSALQQNLRRYTLQLETAAELARTTISSLELGALLTTSVDLIGRRFGLDYVAIYLVADDNRYVELRAATGREGQLRLAAHHRIKVNSATTVGRCLASRRHVLVRARNDEGSASISSWLQHTQSEMTLPLIAHSRVIGAAQRAEHLRRCLLHSGHHRLPDHVRSVGQCHRQRPPLCRRTESRRGSGPGLRTVEGAGDAQRPVHAECIP
ncbi:MAG: GAF domain-containing protein [Anaerolineae bacterium]